MSTSRPTGRPGLVAVAKLAGVAPSTVSNTFNRPHVVSSALKARVLAAARQLEYDGPDPAARVLRGGRLGAIGLVMRERLAYSFDDPAAVETLKGLSDAADRQQLALAILPARPESGEAGGTAVHNAAVDGLILYSLTADDPLLEAVRRRRLPTVLIDSPTPATAPSTAGFHLVGIDERAAARVATQHLLDLGHRRIGVISLRLSAHQEPGPTDLDGQRRATASVPIGRLAGARDAIETAGIAWAAVPVVQSITSSVEEGRQRMRQLLSAAPDVTAVFAFSDPLALGARMEAEARGVRVPRDLSIVGFDDSIPGSALTTVHQPLRDKGRLAAEQLMRDIADPAGAGGSTVLPTGLVIRGSAATARA